MKKMGKWFWAFVGVSVALVVAIVVALVVGLSGNQTPPDDPEIVEGPETGSYYYDAANGIEYTLELYGGNKFILNDGTSRIGEYTVAEGVLSFTFDKESNGTASAVYADGVVTMDYNGAQIRFLRKVSYTVTFDTDDGSAIDNATVVNGRPVAKPADPTKEGSIFIGWYTDAEFTQPYIFNSSIITADTTLYARYVEKVVGQVEFEVVFEGVEDADAAVTTTKGGKVFALPVLEKEGYVFGGWWVSDFNDGEKLTYKCEEGTVLNANTTLYPVWIDEAAEAPLVQVDASGITWNSVSGASTYAVKITAPDGVAVYDQNVGTTAITYDFIVAGVYKIEVTANGVTTTRYYNAKGLPRVSVFEVIEPSTLLFNAVAGAEKYYITIKCGNPAHNHEMVDNGNSTVYNFSNCEMKEGGIEFIVTAAARGYASSVSSTFTFERKLAQITDLTVDAETDTVIWTPVPGAAYYLVEIGGETVRVNVSTFSLKNYAGEITVKVTPVTAGYLSPEAASCTYTKATLPAPTGVVINGTVVSWNAVDGATGYNVKVGAKVIPVTGTSLDLATADVSLVSGEAVEISVMATGAKDSLYSDVLVTFYQSFADELYYSNGYVYWTPVVGIGNYEVKFNGGDSVIYPNTDKAPVVFTKAGVNTVEVRFVSADYTSEWVKLDIMVYSVTLDSRLGSAVPTVYVAAGDVLNIGVPTRVGYTFDNWYTTPSAANGNGKLYNDTVFGERSDIILYANWKANKYNIIIEADSTVSGVTSGDKIEVTYDQGFQLPVPTSDEGTFLGWFTGPGGSGYQLADASGKSVRLYIVEGDTIAHPFFEIGTLTYVMQDDGTYAVTKGPNISKATNVIIPETYDGVQVTVVLENAFKNCTYLETISIPNTVRLVGSGAFSACRNLKEVNVRVVEGNHEVFYSSSDGVLIREDMGTTYLEYFPRSKSGEFTIPEGVDSILTKAFQYAYNLETLNIGTDVTYIAEEAFFHCYMLKSINFIEGGTKPLTIETGAFLDMKVLTSIKFPARLEKVDTATLDACTKLATITAEPNGIAYGAIDGMLTNGTCDTILYCPPTRRGEVTIPVGITAIGEGAFTNCKNITGITISNKVVSIGASAFAGCENVKSIKFDGGRNSDLAIGNHAFSGCKSLTSIEIAGGTTMDTGAVSIGAGAFTGCEKVFTLKIDDNANVVAIGASAFEGISISELTIPATVREIGDNAFAGCEDLGVVTFAENGQDIAFGAGVFSGCRIKSVSLPSTIASFNGAVFQGCDTITEIIVAEDNPYLMSVEGVLYNKTQTELLFYPNKKDVDFAALPATLTKIGPAAFQGHPGIVDLEIPANITEIGNNAFDACAQLASVKFLGTGDVVIGNYAFANCKNLTTVALSDATSAIGSYAFNGSINVNTVNMPSKLASIGAFAFAGTKLTDVALPATLATIGDGAFSDCASLKTLTIADPAEGEAIVPLTIGIILEDGATGAFYKTALTTVTLPARTVLIGSRTFYNLKTLANFSIPADAALETIGDYAFYYNNMLPGITLPNNLKTIGDNAFYYANNAKFTELTVPYTVEYIGYRAFYASKIKTLTFVPTPEGVTPVDLEIGNRAFYYNQALTEVNLPARTTKFFESLFTESGVEYPSLFETFGYSNAKITAINIEDGNPLYMSIDGIVYEKDVYGNPSILLFCPDGKTGEVTIPSTVTQVEYRAFAGLRSKGTQITKITFEEKENWDGVPTLIVGNASGEWDDGASDDKACVVFKSDKLTEIVFPKHIKKFNAGSFSGLTTSTGTTLKFADGTKPVEFGMSVFYNNSSITELDLPPVSAIGEYCFNMCQGIQSIDFAPGSTVTEIGKYALWNCNRVEYIKVPASVTKINTYSLGSSALIDIDFEEGCQLKYMAKNCITSSKLTSFVIPETVEAMEGAALYCSNLKELTLNSTMKSSVGVDGLSIFSSLGSLETIIVPESNPYLTIYEGALYDKNITTLMRVPRSAYVETLENGREIGKPFVIPETVTTIESYAMQGYNLKDGFKNITTIVIPEGVVRIADHAFMSSNTLETITIPASVESIETYAFYYASALKEIKFAPESKLTTIGTYAFGQSAIEEVDLPDTVQLAEDTYGVFSYCRQLRRADLPTGALAVPSSMFSDCSKLEEVTIHEGTQVLGYRAFDACVSLKSITIPASVTSFSSWAGTSDYDGPFDGCTALEEVIFTEGSRLEKLGAGSFDGCLSLKSLTLPEGVGALNPLVFNNCTSLTDLVLNGAWTEIPENYFVTNRSLTNVVLSESALVIGAGAFDNCTNLASINIPESVTSIGDAAFRNTALTSVTLGAALEYLGNYAFDGCAKLESVEFDSGCQITALGAFADVEAAIFRGTTSLKSIALPSTVRTMGASLFENSAIETVELSTDLSMISNSAFKNCVNLTYMYVPEFVATIGDFAFEGCTGLKTVDVAEGVESIGSGAFRNCVNLTKTNIPSTVKKIAGNPYIDCPNLADLTLDPANAAYSYENGVIYDAGKFTLIYYSPTKTDKTFTVPESVVDFAAGAFNNSQLESFELPASLKTIPSLLFYNSKNLKNVTIPVGTTVIESEAFAGCSSLLSVDIPAGVVELGDSAFAGASSLATVNMANLEGKIKLGAHLFDGCAALTEFTLPAGTTELAPYLFAGTGITEMHIPGTITSLYVDGVFANSAITTVTFGTIIPEGSEEEISPFTGYLGAKFFYNCKNLVSIDLPDGIIGLGGYTWAGRRSESSNAKSPLHIYAEDSYAFAGCTSLESIDISKLKIIGHHAFDGCTALTEVITPSTSASNAERSFFVMGDYVFANCTSIEHLALNGFYSNYKFDFLAWDGVVYKGRSDVPMAFGSNLFENCTSLKSVTFPSSIGRLGTDLFVGCTSIEKVDNVYVSEYFTAGATPFDELPENCELKFKMEAPDPTNTSSGLFITKNDEKVVSPNHEWIKNIKAKVVFNYTPLLEVIVGEDGLVTKVKVDLTHAHTFGCEGCAELRSAAYAEVMNPLKALEDGQTVEIEKIQGTVREITKAYDAETGTISFVMYYTYYYDTPIVCNLMTGKESYLSEIITGNLVTLKGTITKIDGVLHFVEGSEVTARSNGNRTYMIGNEMRMLKDFMPTVVTEDMRIEMPKSFVLQFLADNQPDDYDWGSSDTEAWTSDNDCITFEKVEDEYGDVTIYMVIKQQATDQVVTVSANLVYWEMLDNIEYFTITVKGK